MKYKFSAFIAAFGIIATSSVNSSIAFASDQGIEKAAAIKAFVDICLKTAPSFIDAAKAAKSFGIDEISDLGFMAMGSTKDQSIAIQIQKNKECVVTTGSQIDKTLTQQFIQAVGEITNSEAAARTPFKAKIQNEMFIFQHDRKGGEAFVMLKQND